MPQTKPAIQPEPDHKTIDEDTAIKILSKGEFSHLLLTDNLCCVISDSSKFCQVLSTRLENLQLIRRDWNLEDAKVSN